VPAANRLQACNMQRYILVFAVQTSNYTFDPLEDMPADFGPRIPAQGVEGFLIVSVQALSPVIYTGVFACKVEMLCLYLACVQACIRVCANAEHAVPKQYTFSTTTSLLCTSFQVADPPTACTKLRVPVTPVVSWVALIQRSQEQNAQCTFDMKVRCLCCPAALSAYVI